MINGDELNFKMMALLDGKNFRGSIGNISFRKLDENTTSVQSNPGKGNVKQTANTKKSASLFGRLISPFAKHIRFNLKNLSNDLADRHMVNRMNAAISIIINQHLAYNGEIVFKADSFNRLIGFEFNTNSLLGNSLLQLPKVTYEADQVNISFPSFSVSKNIRFPDQTDKVLLQLQPVFFNLSKGFGFKGETAYLDLQQRTTTTEQVFSYHLPADTICIIGLGLLFSSSRVTANDKKFNPAGIFAAHYQEGHSDDSIREGWYQTGFSLNDPTAG